MAIGFSDWEIAQKTRTKRLALTRRISTLDGKIFVDFADNQFITFVNKSGKLAANLFGRLIGLNQLLRLQDTVRIIVVFDGVNQSLIILARLVQVVGYQINHIITPFHLDTFGLSVLPSR